METQKCLELRKKEEYMSLNKCPECGINLTEEMIEANLCWECGAILNKALLEESDKDKKISREETHWYKGKNACELCKKAKAVDSKFGVCLCKNCYEDFEKILKNDKDAIQMCAQKEIIDLAKRKAGLKSKFTMDGVTVSEKLVNNSQVNLKESKNESSNVINTVNHAAKKKVTYRLNYTKVLSEESKREWIEGYASIKRFGYLVWILLGLGISFVVARYLGYGLDAEMFFFLMIGAVVGGVIGTNKVGAAMMQAIIAEQSVVNEELLKEILDKLYEE